MNRRDFLKTSSRGTAAFTLGGFLARAYGSAQAIGPMAASALTDTDRILILIRLDGGNDGLNTLVNFEDDAYYQARSDLNISKSDALPLTDTQGLHPELTGFKALYDEGHMMAVQGVGYPNPNRSHFRSTDIWMTASDANEYLTHGWLGRYLETQVTGDPETLPEHPVAVDIGPVLSLALLGKNGAMGIALKDPRQFFYLVDQGNKILDGQKLPTPAGFELDFVRQVNFESLQYSKQVQDAAETGENTAEYPDSTLADQLALIARLIDGGLKSRVYLVSQRGYDTHSNQLSRHGTLMKDLNGAVSAFQNDLKQLGHQDRVLGLTVSEFGRRVKENGSAGTDHGTAAPLFLFGTSLIGGIHGPVPRFNALDDRGDFHHDFDFRQVYASVLHQWFNVPGDIVQLVFPGSPGLLPLVRVTADLDAVDFNEDGKLDFGDFIAFAREFGGQNPRFDLDGDGTVGFSDFISFAQAFGKRG